MRTRTEQVTQSYEYTMYGCDECEFESDEQETLDRHIRDTHTVRETKEVGGQEYVRFDRQHEYNEYLRTHDLESHGSNYVPGDNWQGPGWYAVVHRTERGHCRCGGCTSEYTYLYSARYMYERSVDDIARIRENAEKEIKRLTEVAYEVKSVLGLQDGTETNHS